ncbi:hypothetical protein KGP36_07780 [Patescibacteria group bacterium]|nr:hypothetical protein [Patescibacteria group bacterium]
MQETAGISEIRRVGRPSLYSDELALRICQRLIEGESLRSITSDEDMPCQFTVFKWLNEKEDFSKQYARAREAQADTIADEILHIADNTEVGVKVTTKPDGTREIVEADMTEHRRLRIDSRKWYAGKLAPKKYGNKMELEHSGSVQHTIGIRAKDLTLEQFKELRSQGYIIKRDAEGQYLEKPVQEAEFENVNYSLQTEDENGESSAETQE